MKSLSMVISEFISTIDKNKSKPDYLALSWFLKFLELSKGIDIPIYF